jgi:hypothetical protein
MRWKNKEEDSIEKAVRYKASTNMRIVTVTNKEPVLTICFRTSCWLKDALEVGGEDDSASNSPGDRDDNTCSGETNIKRRISIIAIYRYIHVGINCQQSYSASR